MVHLHSFTPVPSQKVMISLLELFRIIGGSKGGGHVPPLWVQILSFSCSFRGKFGQIIS